MLDFENNNVFDDCFIGDFVESVDQLLEIKEAKVLILTGGKDFFSAGASYEMLKNISRREFAAKDIKLVNYLLKIPIPIIAVMEGAAVGGGFTLGLSCDMTVASQDQRYGVNFTEVGITPGMGTTTILPALVGYHVAMEMMLTTKYYKGQDLLRRGIFNYVEPTKQVKDTALNLAMRISEKEMHVIRMLKESLALPRRLAIENAIAKEHLMHQCCIQHEQTIKIMEENYRGTKND